MKVWVVLKDYQNDDSTILGVYATPELAEAAMHEETVEECKTGIVEGVNDDDGDLAWDVSLGVDGPHEVEGA